MNPGGLVIVGIIFEPTSKNWELLLCNLLSMPGNGKPDGY